MFSGEGYMKAIPKSEGRDPKAEGLNPESGALELLTREELAVVLKVSLHTVDRMLADGELPQIRLRGRMVRFYLPDVVRALVATALTRKRARGTEAGRLAGGGQRSEGGSQKSVISDRWPVIGGKGAK